MNLANTSYFSMLANNMICLFLQKLSQESTGRQKVFEFKTSGEKQLNSGFDFPTNIFCEFFSDF